jgi:hypothetical protein
MNRDPWTLPLDDTDSADPFAEITDDFAEIADDELQAQRANLAEDQSESPTEAHADRETARNEALRQLHELPDDDVPWRQRCCTPSGRILLVDDIAECRTRDQADRWRGATVPAPTCSIIAATTISVRPIRGAT